MIVYILIKILQDMMSWRIINSCYFIKKKPLMRFPFLGCFAQQHLSDALLSNVKPVPLQTPKDWIPSLHLQR